MFKLALTLTQDNTAALKKALKDLERTQLLVGFPEATAERKQKGLGNPAIAYLNEHGSPAKGIPPRPFLEPGIQSVEGELAQHLTAAVTSALDGDPAGLERGFHRAGLAAQAGIKNYMVAGVPPALSPVTLAHRRRAGIRGTKPLIASGAMFRALTYIVKKTR